jgi:hypothetical protein
MALPSLGAFKNKQNKKVYDEGLDQINEEESFDETVKSMKRTEKSKNKSQIAQSNKEINDQSKDQLLDAFSAYQDRNSGSIKMDEGDFDRKRSGSKRNLPMEKVSVDSLDEKSADLVRGPLMNVEDYV